MQYYVYITKERLYVFTDSTFLLKRPVQKLIPFEIMNCVKEDNKIVPCVTVNHPQ